MLTRPAKILISIVAVLIVCVFATWIWSVGRMTKSVADMAPVTQETDSTLSPGTYLVYQIERMTDYGSEEWANDDTTETAIYRHKVGSNEPDEVVTKISSHEKGGAVIAYPLGTDLIVHRYSNTGDAIVSLDGTAKEIPENWELLRSKNGQYEVEYTDRGDELEFRNLKTGTKKLLHLPVTDAMLRGMGARPDSITNDGSTVYLVLAEGWEGPGATTIWKLDVATDTLTELKSFSKLTHIDFSKQSYAYSLNADQSKI
ncbi:MAG: hypothetical protein AAB431_03305, partial [Patescibacteria group bacterium]